MVRYRFQLMGMGKLGTKYIECDPTLSCTDLQQIVRREYQINRALSIQFHFKGAVMPHKVTLASTGVRPEKDVIAIYTSDYCASRLPFSPLS